MKQNRVLHLFILFILIASTFLATPRPVYAAGVVTIETTKDDGVGCTLRSAIMAANSGQPFGGCMVYGLTEIRLKPGMYKLTAIGTNENGNFTGDLDITASLTITGTGQSSTTGSWIMAEQAFGDRILHVKSPGSAKITVKLSNLAVKGGVINGTPGGGGILVENANLSLYRVLVTQNIVATSATGGGITNNSTSSLVVNQSTFTLNTSGFGGAIYNAGSMTIENSLLRSNTGSTAGGALDNSASMSTEVVIRNSTITSNVSAGGAGIANSGRTTVINATIANNVGSAGVMLYPGSQMSVRNTLLARHDDGPHCDRLEATANFVSNGYNLLDPNTEPTTNVCNFTTVSDLPGVDPLLTLSIGNYDSPTDTYGFTSKSSLAIDAIPVANCPLVDQRLHGRGADGNLEDGRPGMCDIGAYEEAGTFERQFMPIMGR